MSDRRGGNTTKLQRCAVCGFYNSGAALNCQNCGAQLLSGHSQVNSRVNLGDEQTLVVPAPARRMEPPAPRQSVSQPYIQDEVRYSDLTTRRTCERCGHANAPSRSQCENCGSPILGSDRLSHPSDGSHPAPRVTPAYRKPLINIPSTAELRENHLASGDHFDDNMLLRFDITGAAAPFNIRPSGEMIVGRRDSVASGGAPDIDMTTYDAYRLGVSRRHAILRLHDRVIDIRDLGSSNGTFVNGLKLAAHQPHSLRNGDELTLGKMVMRVYFVPIKR